MPPFISLLVLAFAVSLDGFGVGAMYGLRKIRLPLYAVGIISLCTGAVVFLSMKLGQFALQWISASVAQTIGALILVGIGIWAIYQIVANKEQEPKSEPQRQLEQEPMKPGRDSMASDETSTSPTIPVLSTDKKIVSIEIKSIGLVIQILKTPSKADLDQSGNITAPEALLLGLALSLDAFGAGLGAALIGYPPLMSAIVIALSSGIFVAMGLRIGLIYSNLRWIQKMSVLPGCFLILLGIMKLF